MPIANEVFSPTEEEVTRARQIIDSLDETGAVQIDGVMVDAASIRLAENILAIAARSTG